MFGAARETLSHHGRVGIAIALVVVASSMLSADALAQRGTTERIVRIDAPLDEALVPRGYEIDIVGTVANETGAALPQEEIQFFWNGEDRTDNTTFVATTVLYRAGDQLEPRRYHVRLVAMFEDGPIEDEITFHIGARDTPNVGYGGLVALAVIGATLLAVRRRA